MLILKNASKYVPLIFLYCILSSSVNAAALLPLFGYEKFSSFNILCIFILIGIGGNAAILFSFSWKTHTKSKDSVTLVGQPTSYSFFNAYFAFGLVFLFTTCAGIVSLFSKLASPVVVISELGAFMGSAVAIFYINYHYIYIPIWLWTDSFTSVICKNSFYRKVDNNGYFCMDSSNSIPTAIGTSDECDDTNSEEHTYGNTNLSTSSIAGNESITEVADGGVVLDANDTDLPFSGDKNHSMESISKTDANSRIVFARLAVFVLVLLLFVSPYLVYEKASIDTGIPQLFDSSSNLGQLLVILKNYKSEIFTVTGVASIPIIGGNPTTTPTNAPALVPSMTPTVKPTYRHSPTASPLETFSPTTLSPTESPTTYIPTTQFPTYYVDPSSVDTYAHQDYTVIAIFIIKYEQ